MHRLPCPYLIALLLLPMPGHGLPSLRPAIHAPTLLKVQDQDVGANGAAGIVRKTTGGKVLAVKRLDTDNGPVYRVKVLLTGGRVRVLLVDAASGSIR